MSTKRGRNEDLDVAVALRKFRKDGAKTERAQCTHCGYERSWKTACCVLTRRKPADSKPLCNTTTLMRSYNRLTSCIVILSPKSLIQNPENRQNLGLQNIEDPAQNFGQDPDLLNPVRSGFTFRTDRTPKRGSVAG